MSFVIIEYRRHYASCLREPSDLSLVRRCEVMSAKGEMAKRDSRFLYQRGLLMPHLSFLSAKQNLATYVFGRMRDSWAVYTREVAK